MQNAEKRARLWTGCWGLNELTRERKNGKVLVKENARVQLTHDQRPYESYVVEYWMLFVKGTRQIAGAVLDSQARDSQCRERVEGPPGEENVWLSGTRIIGQIYRVSGDQFKMYGIPLATAILRAQSRRSVTFLCLPTCLHLHTHASRLLLSSPFPFPRAIVGPFIVLSLSFIMLSILLLSILCTNFPCFSLSFFSRLETPRCGLFFFFGFFSLRLN